MNIVFLYLQCRQYSFLFPYHVHELLALLELLHVPHDAQHPAVVLGRLLALALALAFALATLAIAT